VLTISFEVSDSAPSTTALAAGPTDRRFTIRALPSITPILFDQPEILFVNDNGHGEHEAAYLTAFLNAGLREGIDFDTYTVRDPEARLSNGIGASAGHGANADQLAGYSAVIYVSGRHEYGISDGSNVGVHDKSDDLGVLGDWQHQMADRSIAYFGDNLVSGLATSGPGQIHLGLSMGVVLLGPDISTSLGTVSPDVVADSPFLFESFGILGNGSTIDAIEEADTGPSLIVGHRFEANGVMYPTPVASILHDRLDVQYRKVDLTFPFDLAAILEPNPKVPLNVRSRLLREILDLFGSFISGPITDAPATPCRRPARFRIPSIPGPPSRLNWPIPPR